MRVSMIVAVSRNGVIGRADTIPWHLPDEMRHFKATTWGHAVIMGRRTFESLGRPLAGRRNIVVTNRLPPCPRDGSLDDAVLRVPSLAAALEAARQAGESEAFVIGGASLYREAQDLAHRVYLSEIDAIVEGDTFFSLADRPKWRETSRSFHPQDARHAHAFTIHVLERVISSEG